MTKINIWTFFFLYVFYAFISIYFFIISSLGWVAGLWILPLASLLFFTLHLYKLLNKIIILHKEKRGYLLASHEVFTILLISQLIVLLFNMGSGPHGPGDLDLAMFLWSPTPVSYSSFHSPLFLGNWGFLVWFISIIFYVLMVLVFTKKVLNTASPE